MKKNRSDNWHTSGSAPVLGRATHCSSLGHYAVTQRRQPAADQDPPCRVRGVRAGPGRGGAGCCSAAVSGHAELCSCCSHPASTGHIPHCCWAQPATDQTRSATAVKLGGHQHLCIRFQISTSNGHRCLENEFKWKVSGKEMSFFLWISRKIDCMFLDISEIASWLEKIRFSRNSIHRYYPISSAYLL